MPKLLKSNGLRDRVWGVSESVEHPEGGRVWVRPPESNEIRDLHRLLHTEISPQAGTLETMTRVFAHNRDCFWLIEHRAPQSESPKIIGFYAFLPLTAEGHAALRAHTLDPVISRAMGWRYAGAPLYARVTTADGLKSGVGAGSASVSGETEIGMGSLIRVPTSGGALS